MLHPEFDRITQSNKSMMGQVCIRGMRITVDTVANLVAQGCSTQEIIHMYPYLEEEDIRQAVAYVAWLTVRDSEES